MRVSTDANAASGAQVNSPKSKRLPELRSRTLTALALIPIVIGALFYLPPQGILFLGVIAATVCGLEWARLSHIYHTGRLGFALFIGAMTWALTALDPFWLAAAVLAWWLLVLFELPVFRPQTDEPIYRASTGLAGLVTIAPSFAILVDLFQVELWYGLGLLLLVWMTDIGAYVVGSLYGRHQMAAHISAGKTWEGTLGGVALAGILGGVLAYSIEGLPASVWMVLIAVLTALAGQLGDLSESMYKRRAGYKDSGKWLPGHGGLLDRVDALSTAVPIYTLCLYGILI